MDSTPADLPKIVGIFVDMPAAITEVSIKLGDQTFEGSQAFTKRWLKESVAAATLRALGLAYVGHRGRLICIVVKSGVMTVRIATELQKGANFTGYARKGEVELEEQVVAEVELYQAIAEATVRAFPRALRM